MAAKFNALFHLFSSLSIILSFFHTPAPLGILNDLPWGMYGYFVEFSGACWLLLVTGLSGIPPNFAQILSNSTNI